MDLPPDLLRRVRGVYAAHVVERAEANARRMQPPCTQLVLEMRHSGGTSFHMPLHVPLRVPLRIGAHTGAQNIGAQNIGAQNIGAFVLLHVKEGRVKVACCPERDQWNMWWLERGRLPDGWGLSLRESEGLCKVSLRVGLCPGAHTPSQVIRFMAGMLRDLAEGRRVHSLPEVLPEHSPALSAALARHAAAWRAWTTGPEDAEIAVVVGVRGCLDDEDVSAVRHAVRVAMLPVERQADFYTCWF
jgi:hypothetical protein